MRSINSPQEMAALMKECIQSTYQYIQQCNNTFGICLPQYPIVFTLRGTTAGRAYYSRGFIAYNPTLLRENPDHFLKQTVGHEVVHMASFQRYGTEIGAHGPEWKSMMRTLGLPPSRCHNYDVAHVPTVFGKMRNATAIKVIRTEVGTVRSVGIGKVINFD